MKRFIWLSLVLLAFPTYGNAGTKGSALTDASATVAGTDYLLGYILTGPGSRRYTINSILALKTSVTGGALGLLAGTYANGNLCTYASSGTLLNCNTATSTFQAADADLTTYAGITPSANIQSLLGSADYSAARTNLGLAIGTNVQAYDADLTTWAGVTPGTGVATAAAAAVNGSGGFLTYGDTAGTAAVLTGYTSGAGTVSGTDTILGAIQKLNGNLADAFGAGADGERGMKGTSNTIDYSLEEAGTFAYTEKAGVPKFYAGTSEKTLLLNDAVVPPTADGAALGSATLEYSDLYLATGGVIYGQNGQENTITSSATGWDFNLPLGLMSANDPDVAAEGKISWDANGDVLRGYDGTRQVAAARVQEEIHVTVVKPQDLADGVRDAFIVWSNESGMSFVVTGWKAWSQTDDTTLNIEEIDADGQNNATVDAVEIATNGTGIYTASDTTITAATIENGHLLLLDFDDTDDPAQVKLTIYGYYDANVN